MLFMGFYYILFSLTYSFKGWFIISSYASANFLNLSVQNSFRFLSAFGFFSIVSTTLTALSFLLDCCSVCCVSVRELVRNKLIGSVLTKRCLQIGVVSLGMEFGWRKIVSGGTPTATPPILW